LGGLADGGLGNTTLALMQIPENISINRVDAGIPRLGQNILPLFWATARVVHCTAEDQLALPINQEGALVVGDGRDDGFRIHARQNGSMTLHLRDTFSARYTNKRFEWLLEKVKN